MENETETKKEHKRVSEKQLEGLLKISYGNIAGVAKELGVSRQSVWNRVQKSKRLQEAVEEAREKLVDMAESKLARAVGAGQEWAVKRVLDSQRGAERGWRPPAMFEGRIHHDGAVEHRLDDQTAAEILERLKPKEPGDPPAPPQEGT